MSTTTGTTHRYQRWQRKPARFQSSYLAIVRTGIRQANQDSHLRMLVWGTLSFVVGTCGLLYTFAAIEILAGTPRAENLAEFARGFAYNMLRIDLPDVSEIGKYRAVLWRAVFLLAFKVELFWVMITASRVGPGLIADDIRARALPIYFARPITPLSYLAGKWSVLAFFIAIVVLVPNLAALLLSVVLTGGLQTAGQTLDLIGDVLCAGLGVMVFGGALMLALSATVADRRFVAVGWFMVCVLPMVAQKIIWEALQPRQPTGLLGSISPADNCIALAEWLFDLRRVLTDTGLPTEAFQRTLFSNVDPLYPAIVVATLTGLCLWWSHRRVVRFSRAAANIQ